MGLIHAIPLTIRAIPALVICLVMLGVLVFLARHPVDGDDRVLAAARQNVFPGTATFAVAAVFLVPTLPILALSLAVTLAAHRFQGDADRFLGSMVGHPDDRGT